MSAQKIAQSEEGAIFQHSGVTEPKVIYDYEVDEIPASFVTVEYSETGELDLPSKANFVCLDNCPKFVEAMNH